VTILLAEHVEHDFRPQRLDDLLERPETFVAVTDRRTGKPRLLSKEALLWLRVPLPERDLSEDDLFGNARRIAVHLTDGSSVAGDVLYDVPSRAAAEAPLADFMNQQGHYFEIAAEGRIYFVHKKFVSWIDELPGVQGEGRP
jgi:hypothetical protein